MCQGQRPRLARLVQFGCVAIEQDPLDVEDPRVGLPQRHAKVGELTARGVAFSGDLCQRIFGLTGAAVQTETSIRSAAISRPTRSAEKSAAIAA